MPPTPTTATSGQRIVDCGHLHYVRLRQVYAASGSSASFDLPRTYLYYVRLRQAYVVLGSSAPFELPHAYLFALGLATRPALADSLWATPDGNVHDRRQPLVPAPQPWRSQVNKMGDAPTA
jgi:hypothetical protein